MNFNSISVAMGCNRGRRSGLRYAFSNYGNRYFPEMLRGRWILDREIVQMKHQRQRQIRRRWV